MACLVPVGIELVGQLMFGWDFFARTQPAAVDQFLDRILDVLHQTRWGIAIHSLVFIKTRFDSQLVLVKTTWVLESIGIS